jgi:hypothetical protein
VGGLGEGGVDAGLVGLERPGVAGIGAEVLVDDDPVGDGVLEVDDGRQFLVVDHHAFEGVHGLLAGLGHDDRHRVTDVVHGAAGQRVVGRDLLVGRGGHGHRERSGPLPHQLLAGVDGDDAGGGLGGRGVDRTDARPGDRAADDRQPQCPGNGEVVDVLRFAGEDLGVLPAEQTLTQHGGHTLTSPGRRRPEPP